MMKNDEIIFIIFSSSFHHVSSCFIIFIIFHHVSSCFVIFSSFSSFHHFHHVSSFLGFPKLQNPEKIGNKNPKANQLGPPGHFVSCVMVWAAGAKVVGSRPTGGILAQMCECACNASTHSIVRNLPPFGARTWVARPAVRNLTQLEIQSVGTSATPPKSPGGSRDIYISNYRRLTIRILIAVKDASFFGAILTPIPDRLKWPGNEAFLAAIRVRKSGTVNPQRSVRDVREILGKLRPIHRQSRRPHSGP